MVILLFAHHARKAFEAWSKENGLDAESILTSHLNALAKEGICTVENAESLTARKLHILISNPSWAKALSCSLGSDGKFFYKDRPFH